MIRLSDAKILCVDDEPGIIKVMERALGEEFTVLSAGSGQEGLRILSEHPDMAVIISDLKMEGMNGMDFLVESRTIAPEAMRILITAYADTNVLADAINKGHVYKFLPKPFEMEWLTVSVRRAAEHHLHKKAYEATHREWVKSQEKLAQAEKLSMLGQLLSAVAHELGNPISNIRQAAALAQREWKDLSEFLHRVEKTSESDRPALLNQLPEAIRSAGELENIFRTMQNASALVSDIIRDLRGFSRLDDAQWTAVNVQEIVERAVNLVRPKYKYSIQFHKQFDAVPQVIGLPGPLTQVVLNLLSNAAQSIQSQGDVWIRAWHDEDGVRISVRDNGRGISEEHLPMIFESGFTTKEEAEGTGLGLTISNGIVQKHGGAIDVWSVPGQGSEFVVRLPVKQTIP